MPARRKSQRRTRKNQSDAARVKTAKPTAATQISQVGGGASKRAAPKRSRVSQEEGEMVAVVPKSRGCPEAEEKETTVRMSARAQDREKKTSADDAREVTTSTNDDPGKVTSAEIGTTTDEAEVAVHFQMRQERVGVAVVPAENDNVVVVQGKTRENASAVAVHTETSDEELIARIDKDVDAVRRQRNVADEVPSRRNVVDAVPRQRNVGNAVQFRRSAGNVVPLQRNVDDAVRRQRNLNDAVKVLLHHDAAYLLPLLLLHPAQPTKQSPN